MNGALCIIIVLLSVFVGVVLYGPTAEEGREFADVFRQGQVNLDVQGFSKAEDKMEFTKPQKRLINKIRACEIGLDTAEVGVARQKAITRLVNLGLVKKTKVGDKFYWRLVD